MTLATGWASTTFSDVADTKLGKMLDAAKNRGNHVPYLRNVNVRWGRFDLSDLQQMRVSSEELEQLRVQDGDIFVCEGGEPGRAAVWRGDTQVLVFQKALHRLRIFPGVSPDYLCKYLRFAADSALLDKLMTGTTIRHLPQIALQRLPVAMPPAEEQRRIVAKLDTLTARLARARAELDLVSPAGESLRHKTLLQAFRGVLTAQWRSEVGHQEAVAVRPETQIAAKYRLPRSAEPPFEIPSSWRWCRLPELGEMDRGRSRHRPRNERKLYGGPHPFVQTGDIRAARHYLTEYSQTYSDFGLAQSRKWPRGTVCITIAANIAETCILGIDACFPDSVVGFVPDTDRVHPEYIEYFLRTAKADLERFAPATAQKNINLETLATVVVPIPPIREQHEILRRIGATFSGADRLGAEATRARALLDRLESALLAKAFRGELVPQDPNDEPASVLLDRIRAQREAAPPARKIRRAKA